MTDATANGVRDGTAAPGRRDIGIKRRYRAERRFKIYGIVAIAIGLFFLVALLWSVVSKGYTAFWQTEIQVPVTFSEEVIGSRQDALDNPTKLMMANYPTLARDGLVQMLGVDAEDRAAVKEVGKLISSYPRRPSAQRTSMTSRRNRFE